MNHMPPMGPDLGDTKTTAIRLSELRSMPLDRLMNTYDGLARGSLVGHEFFLNEIARRDAQEQTNRMLEYTKQIKVMTIIMTFAAVFSMLAAFVSVWALVASR